MAAITAKMVKELRDKTGAGMLDCKKALAASDGDVELAIEHLRKAGIAKAAKKAGRTTNEGSVVIHIQDGTAAVVEVLCETDFVARNAKFRQYAADLARRVAVEWDGDGDLSEQIRKAEEAGIGELVSNVGENIRIRRAVRWTGDGEFASYIHMGGKIGVLLEAAGETTQELLNDVCMHIAAFSPRYIQADDVPPEVVAKEKEIAAAQMAGKPPQILEKIIAGKVNKWFTEVCLFRQPWLRDDKKTLAKVAPNLQVRRFLRWQIGEDID
ncbi:MAG: elongation factor Ts [Kiritimatiellaeota bacterium]|nr:elongation factor Ts [Kiritimatiellota bacterium]